jgi:hypothetical protein
MQVKDYIQALTDENHIRVEKIGSGNWYWSFMSDEKIKREQALSKAQAERNRAAAVVGELQQKVNEAGVAREDVEDDMLMESGNDRRTLTMKHVELMKELETLRTELAAYRENDPVEVEKQRAQVVLNKREVEKRSDEILSMESWVKQRAGGDKAQFLAMKKSWYGDQFDEEEAGLKEL